MGIPSQGGVVGVEGRVGEMRALQAVARVQGSPTGPDFSPLGGNAADI